MIARNAESEIRETIQSLRANLFLRETDELLVVDTGSTDSTVKVCEELGARVIRKPDLLEDLNGELRHWLPEQKKFAQTVPQVRDGVIRSFAEARNLAMARAKNHWQFWIDSDDVLAEEEPGMLRKLIDEEIPAKGLSTLFLDYDYAFDTDGKCTVVLKRERVYDRRQYEWKGPCHEVLVKKPGVRLEGGAGFYKDVPSKIVHRKERGTGKASDLRNYLILRKAIELEEEEFGQADIRLYFYFANACRGLSQWKDAVKYYKKTIELSGSRDDVYLAHLWTATIYLDETVRSPARALRWAYRALEVKNDDPRAYFLLQHSYFLLKQWSRAAWWFEVGRQLPEPVEQLHVYDPQQIRYTPYLIAALTFKELDEPQRAAACIEVLQQERPNHPDTALCREQIENWRTGKSISASVRLCAQFTDAQTSEEIYDNTRSLAAELKVVPSELEKDGIGVREPEDKRTGKDLVIYCAKTSEPWGPKSARKGLGGSERAVWEVARRMQRRGFRVTVYNDCPGPERGFDDDSVLWRHWCEFDRMRPRGTIIYWRAPEFLELPFAAEKRIVWCHDVQSPERWSDAHKVLVDRVFVLSGFHGDTLGDFPPEKVTLTQNGIDVGLLRRAMQRVKKHRKKIIFCSSPDRGVLSALRVFRLASEHMSGLEFHAFYGFGELYHSMARTSWCMHVPDLARNREMLSYQAEVEEAMDETPGAFLHGRVSWDEMAEAYASAGTLLYPTRFPEISCIVAMEAQAAGCCIVASDHAALKETVLWHRHKICLKISPDQELKEQAAALCVACGTPADDPQRAALSQEAMERFDWDKVCDSWVDEVSP
jgi:glycosyltransferase involved in cell wall biosynthesis